jgi:hypothetical protein
MKHEAGLGPLLASHGITAVIAAAVWNRGRVVSYKEQNKK